MRNFWQKFKKALRAYFIVIGVFTTLYMVVGATALYYIVKKATAPEIEETKINREDTLLTLKISGGFVVRSRGRWEVFASRALGMPEGVELGSLRGALRRAAAEPLVKGLHLEIGNVSGTLSEFTQLREAILEFKNKTKKPITASLDSISNQKLMLASVADHISLARGGSIMIPGPSLTLTYFGEAIRKLGVNVEVVKAGSFKAAGEPFLQNAPSKEARENYSALEASLRTHLTSMIAEGRKVPPEQVTAWFNRAIWTAPDAMKAKIVDDLLGEKDAIEAAKKSIKAKQAVSLQQFDDDLDASEDSGALAKTAAASVKTKSPAGIGLITLSGEINMEAGANESGINPDSTEKQLKSLREKDEVKAIVIRVNSPGGSATASDVIWEQVKEAAAKKPVIISMADTAASGGYYLATAAQEIFAEPMTVTGSIGVIAIFPKLTPIEKKYGVSFHSITQTARVGLVDPSKPLSEEDRRLLRENILDTYGLFLDRVAAGRKMKKEDVAALAEGRVYTGIRAKELKLVDRLGTLNDALDRAKELGGLDPKKLYPLYVPSEDRPQWRDLLMALGKRTSLELGPLSWLPEVGPAADAAGKTLSSIEKAVGRGEFSFALSPNILWK